MERVLRSIALISNKIDILIPKTIRFEENDVYTREMQIVGLQCECCSKSGVKIEMEG
jgi:hypothetical protein